MIQNNYQKITTPLITRIKWKIISFFFLFFLIVKSNILLAQPHSIILGRPTNNSITASILFEQNVEYYLTFGTLSNNHDNQTPNFINISGTPDEVDMQGLQADTKYYYKVKFKPAGTSSYSETQEYSFHTQRLPGSEFSFTLEADEHLYDKKGVKSIYQICLDNQKKDNPDFMMSLGDIFGDDHNPFTITSDSLDILHKNYRPFLGSLCHSIPFYVCLGNHEGENDYYLLQNPPNNLAINATLWRKFYYPNPYPNSFYSGNTEVEPFGVDNPENYYSWTWGDALFVVLDVYRNECDTSPKPKNWNWSLGYPQYSWLKSTLENSTAKFKFVFAHHVRGQGRGGVTNAKLFEWGGYEQNGVSYTFDTNRPGWGKPIHQLFKDNGVNIFFQGHDHVFAHEILDSVTYQALPMAADSTYEIGMLANASAYLTDTLDGTGHIKVTVNGSCVKVDYVRAYLPADTISGLHHNGEMAFSYTIGECSTQSTADIKKIESINIYPNPSKNVININYNNNIVPKKLRLINGIGQTFLQENNKQIDVSEYPNGLYFLVVETEHSVITNKVIINH